MKKVHHDSRTYEEANSEAAQVMRDKLHGMIEKGRSHGQAMIEKIVREVPDDRVVPDGSMIFAPDGSQIILNVGANREPERIHSNAMSQIAAAAGIPQAYISKLLTLFDGDRDHEGALEDGQIAFDPWGAALAAQNLNELLHRRGARHLHRRYDGQLRGFLSTSYRRVHPGQMLDSFVMACKKIDAQPYEAYSGDTKFVVKAIVTHLIEPVKDEVIALGVAFHESPYGNGATEILPFIERMWCTNKAVMSSTLRQVHLGGRLSDDIEWSEETYEADTKATCLGISDIVRGQLGPRNVNRLCGALVAAHEQKITAKDVEAFLKKAMSKEEAEQVVELFNGAEIENLPKGQNHWRFSNALSFFAHSVEDEDRRYEVQKLAGKVLDKLAG